MSFPYGAARLLVVFAAFALAFHVDCPAAQEPNAPARIIDDEFAQPAPVRRLALVVGNSAYESESVLPGVPADLATIVDMLRGSGFDVDIAKDVTRAQFTDDYLLPFLNKISRDDFVVFYFAGHGFNYAGENYLVPVKVVLPEPLFDDDLFFSFISARSVQDRITERRPGFLLMLLDACRNISNRTIIPRFDPTAERRVAKGLAEMRAPSGNVVIGFSSDAGKPSVGSSVPGELSVYTAALAKLLPKEDTPLERAQMQVRTEVLFETRNQREPQQPWFSHGSSAIIYFRPSPSILAQEEQTWRSVYKDMGERTLFEFIQYYSVSRFVRHARKLYAEVISGARQRLTRISPVAPELAWESFKTSGTYSDPGQAIKLKRIEGPLAFRRVVGGDVKNTIDLSDVAAAAPSERPFPTYGSADEARIGRMFVEHGKAVLTGPVAARTSADAAAKVVATLETGTAVSVYDVQRGDKGQLWAKLGTPSLKQPVFVEFTGTTGVGTTNIGRPLLETNVGVLKGGLRSLNDISPVRDAIKKLREAGRSIAWVSIATPASPRAGEDGLLLLRAAHLTYELEQAGVPRTRVSVIEKAKDLVGEDLRVRLFGN